MHGDTNEVMFLEGPTDKELSLGGQESFNTRVKDELRRRCDRTPYGIRDVEFMLSDDNKLTVNYTLEYRAVARDLLITEEVTTWRER